MTILRDLAFFTRQYHTGENETNVGRSRSQCDSRCIRAGIKRSSISTEWMYINNNDDNECIINDLGELNDEEDEISISRPFDILTQSQNDPVKSAKSKAKVREKMENTVLQKSLVVHGQARD